MRNLLVRIADFFRESDKLMLVLCLAATSFGCAAVFSSTRYMESFRPILVQVICLFLGIFAALVISAYDYEKLFKKWYLIALIGLVPVILTFFFGYAPEGTDDQAWLDLGITAFQPSELMKVCFIVTFSAHLKKVKPNINKFKNLVLIMIHGFFPVGLIFLQGDWGTAIVFGVITIFMMWAAGVSWKLFVFGITSVLVAAPFFYLFVLSEAHRNRILTLFTVEKDIQGIYYQQWLGSTALANGGMFGKGFMKGDLTQIGRVPESHNDFIFVSIGEEFGFIGCAIVLLLLAAICLRCIRVARVCINDGGKFICVGVFAMIFAQAVINIGMCTSVLPVIGVTLPFFSSGGTSLLCLFLGVGLALNVYKHRNSRILYLGG